jgi:hypothetical protein
VAELLSIFWWPHTLLCVTFQSLPLQAGFSILLHNFVPVIALLPIMEMKSGTHLQGWSIWHLPNPTWTIVYLHYMLAPQNNKHNCMYPCWESSCTPNLILQLKDDLLIVQRSSCSNQNGTSSSKPNSSDGASSSHFFIPSTPKLKALQLQRWTLHNVKGWSPITQIENLRASFIPKSNSRATDCCSILFSITFQCPKTTI